MTDKRLLALLDDIRAANPEHYQLVQEVRELVMRVVPEAGEEVKYGGVLFSLSSSFCGVFAYSKHVSLELSQGALLPDGYGVLEGSGKFRRHIKLHEPADLESKHVAHYVGLAATQS